MQLPIILMSRRFWACAASLCLLLPPALLVAQTDAGLSAPTRKAVTDVAAYDSLIHIAVTIDDKAQELDAKNTPHGMRKGMMKKFGLSADEMPVFLADCHKAHDKISNLDNQASQIIANFQKKLANQNPHAKQPSPPQELAALQQRRNAAVREAMADFDAHLSKTSHQKLRMYLQSLVGTATIIPAN